MNSLEWLKSQNKKIEQDKLHLKNTRIFAGLYRTLIANQVDYELAFEMYKLIEESAKYEWGRETIVDDFIIPGRIFIKNNRKEEII